MEALAIATLAFIGTKAAETTVEKFTEAALEKMNLLRQKIIDKLRGNPKAEKALRSAEDGSDTDVEVVSKYLEEAMAEDDQFAQEIKALAREINNLNQVEGENWQVSGDVNYKKVFGDDRNYNNNDNKAPVFQSDSIGQVNFNNYNYPPGH